MNPGELPISARKSGRRPPRETGGDRVLRPRSTCEGGEPQGFRKERPRNPLEGRGEQGGASVGALRRSRTPIAMGHISTPT
jgi:hypothetical protein